MYAVLQQSGHQYRVSPGDRLLVDRLDAEVGSVVALEPVVLVVGDDAAAQVGTPVVDGVRIAATVVSHRKGAKIRVFKYKPKKHYRRTHGHRSLLTELRVEAVLGKGEALPKREKAPEAKAKPSAEARSAAAKSAPSAEARGAAAKSASSAKSTPAAKSTSSAESKSSAKSTPSAKSTSSPSSRSAAAKPKGDAGTPKADAAELAADATEAPETHAATAAGPADSVTPKRAPRSRAKKPDTEPTPADPGEMET
jgi:large subunit ribosomal protein L21